MKSKALFFKVGLFVSIGFVLMVIVVILFGAGMFRKNKIFFETYFDESVQGLNVGAPVKYRGVKIGSVDSITFAGDEYDIGTGYENKCGRYVMIKMAIDKDILGNTAEVDMRKALDKFVKEDGLRLRLAYLGVTGMAYLEIDFMDVSGIEPLFICWEPKYTYLPSIKNTIARLEESLNDIMEALDSDFFPLLKNISSASENVPELIDKLNTTLTSVDSIISGQKGNFADISNNIQILTKDMKDLVSVLKENPSQLVFGSNPPKSELIKR